MKMKPKPIKNHTLYECPYPDCDGILELVKSKYVKRPGLMRCTGHDGHYVHPDDFICEDVVDAEVLKVVKKESQCVFG